MNGSHQSVPQGSRQSYKPSYRAEESAHTYEADQLHADVKCLVRSQYCSVVLEDADERLFGNILRTVKWFMEIVFFFLKKMPSLAWLDLCTHKWSRKSEAQEG